MVSSVHQYIVDTESWLSRVACRASGNFFWPFSIYSSFLWSPLAGKRDIVVTILVQSMCMCLCASTIMHGFPNNLAQLLPLKRRSAI